VKQAPAVTRDGAALRTLLAGVVDYAGLFPPAALDMEAAVANYARYRTGPDRWALGRFVVNASRLAELEETARPHFAQGDPWRLSVLGGSEHEIEAELAHGFNRRNAGRAIIDSAEVRAASPGAIARAVAAYGRVVRLFVEIPIAEDPAAIVAAIGDAGASAKVRTGGVTADAFPTSAQLARFIERCVSAQVPFKATAGLHHPLRASYRLTYAPDSASAPMFGFLNVFGGAALLRAGMPAARLPELLEETDASAFTFDDDGLAWRQWRATPDDVSDTRRLTAMSFGSCSFEEPMGDLRALGLA
jgi:hypothetical protein